MASTTPNTDHALDGIRSIITLMQAHGLPATAAAFVGAQAAYETNGFTSRVYIDGNNASGIKYAKQKGAKQGPAPAHYAYFDNLGS